MKYAEYDRTLDSGPIARLYRNGSVDNPVDGSRTCNKNIKITLADNHLLYNQNQLTKF